jgi:hypothetical protein
MRKLWQTDRPAPKLMKSDFRMLVPGRKHPDSVMIDLFFPALIYSRALG